MVWSAQQERALATVNRWYTHGRLDQEFPLFRLFGYAGTGKTTLAKAIAENIDGQVLAGAYTGKAAHVLSTKGLPARTLHSLIYCPSSKSEARLKQAQVELATIKEEINGYDKDSIPAELRTRLLEAEQKVRHETQNLNRPSFTLNLESELRNCKLLIVDECSMVDQQMAEDLLYFKVPILVLGDPAQLPPVRGTGYFINAQPDFLLTEIHRQARDNPILEMSRLVREGQRLRPGTYGSSRVYESGRAVPPGLLGSVDQLLVGRNATRRSQNQRFRKAKGMSSPYPMSGDKLVCLQNNNEVGLLNGQLWYCDRDAEGTGDHLSLGIRNDYNHYMDVEAHSCIFLGQEVEWYDKKSAECFDYGYALTVHKSQGSQWPQVMILDEWNGADYKNWLYTAITRAEHTVHVVQL